MTLDTRTVTLIDELEGAERRAAEAVIREAREDVAAGCMHDAVAATRRAGVGAKNLHAQRLGSLGRSFPASQSDSASLAY
jgi:hypothetical protein